jgi:two-component system response regulator YesN
MENETPLGGLFFGKCLWQHVNKATRQDITKRLQGLRLKTNNLTASIDNLPVISSRKIHEAAEFLFILLYEVAELDPRIIKWRRLRTQQQAEISEFIQQNKKTGIDKQYPYQSERELIGKVKIGDRTGAKEILNSLLGTIMFQNPGDLNILKARLVELLTVLSRSAAEGGVDINLLLEKNLTYLNKVINIDSQEDLCAWISLALNDFIESVYTSQDARKITQIKPAIEYIEACYDQPIILADIAKAAHLSISRLAHLFKEQMGITIIDYLTEVRINQAKRLLLSTDKTCTKICFDVGYNNQSYFTRTFKEAVGMTPRKFRNVNQRKNSMPSQI